VNGSRPAVSSANIRSVDRKGQVIRSVAAAYAILLVLIASCGNPTIGASMLWWRDGVPTPARAVPFGRASLP